MTWELFAILALGAIAMWQVYRLSIYNRAVDIAVGQLIQLDKDTDALVAAVNKAMDALKDGGFADAHALFIDTMKREMRPVKEE